MFYVDKAHITGSYGGKKFINKDSLYSLRNIFAFVKICCILENYYRTNVKKYLYQFKEKSLKYLLLWITC